MRDGYVVTWQGREYDAAPEGEGVRIYAPEAGEGFEEVRPGRHVRVLGPHEYENLVYIRTTCTWRGQPFIVLAEADAWLRVEYTGGEGRGRPGAPGILGVGVPKKGGKGRLKPPKTQRSGGWGGGARSAR